MNSIPPAIVCENVWKTFRLHTHQKLLRQHLASWLGGGGFTQFDALKGVSFQVAQGEGLAAIGSDGAARAPCYPSSRVGQAEQRNRKSEWPRGRAAGAGLRLPSGSDRAENVYLNAELLGFSERQTEDMFDDIVEFAGVRDFIDEPLRNYPSGMMMRLAFSVAVNVDPDLIVDEGRAVGDMDFQAKSYEKIRDFRRAGETFLCVSHNPQVRPRRLARPGRNAHVGLHQARFGSLSGTRTTLR